MEKEVSKIHVSKYWDKLNKDRARALKKWPPEKIKKKEIEWRNTLTKKLNDREVKGYFSWDFLSHIPFYFFVVVSTRNNGKSFSTFRLLEEYWQKKKVWLLIRNTLNEVHALGASLQPWFKDNKWIYKSGTGQVVSKKTGETVGWIKSLSQAYVHKSNEFNASLIVFDEFMGKKRKKDQFLDLMNYCVTAQRQNPDFKILLMANYVYSDNDILTRLSLTNSKNELTFNFISKAVFWKVPPTTFEEFRTENNASFLSILSSKEAYEDNFGAGNYRENLDNLDVVRFDTIYDQPELIIVEPKFEIVFKTSNETDELYIEKLQPNELIAEENKEVLKVTTNKRMVNKTHNIQKINPLTLSKLSHMWENEELKFRGSATIRDLLTTYFQDIKFEEERRELVYEAN